VPFETVLACELEEIDRSRECRTPPPKKSGAETPQPASTNQNEKKAPSQFADAHNRNLLGLAFSGGGIRSATFNLGILQALARAGLLSKVDYLSTVSGGGYIGSWLAAWISHRRGVQDVERELAARPEPGKAFREPPAVNFLRDYSNYLTPRKGIFGADTWAAIAIYLRNTLLNVVILISAVGAALLLPLAIGRAFASPRFGSWTVSDCFVYLLVACFFILALLALVFLAINMRYLAGPNHSKDASFYAKEKWIQILIVIPLFLAALALCCIIRARIEYLNWPLWVWSLSASDLYAVLWAVAGGLRGTTAGNHTDTSQGLPWDTRWGKWIVFLSALLAGATGGALLCLLRRIFCSWQSTLGREWHIAAFGPPLVVLIFLAVGVVHLGLIGRSFNDDIREWWGRLGGWLLIYSLFWASLFGAATYAPLGLALLTGWVKLKTAAILGWIFSTLGGLLAGRSAATSGKADSKSPLELAARVAPFVFVLGLLALLSVGIHDAALKIVFLQHSEPATCGSASSEQPRCPEPPAQGAVSTLKSGSLLTSVAPQDSSINLHLELQMRAPEGSAASALATRLKYWKDLNTVPALYWFCGFGVFVVLAFILSWRVDINQFSMQLLYRNRLVRCYLGASRPDRKANPFTGFDPEDDVLIGKLRSGKQYFGPFPIVNAALNITHGERLAWQERKAESFVFTPLYCGFSYPELDFALDLHGQPGFRPTRKYGYPDGGVFLGTAMGISGAAASPNMGYHTSPPLAFLMTVFNVRLGWWLGNPRREDWWTKGGPTMGLFYLLAELIASTTDRSRFVYLSDGGHFENLGIYELVRRRCRLIVACDADADPEFKLDDLGNAIRKCRSDFGIPISLRMEPLSPSGEKRHSPAHYVVGKIHYGEADKGAEDGTLLYIKTSLTDRDPADVQSYAAAHPDFPQQSTAEQWFDESQFESYRALGFAAIREPLRRIGDPDEPMDYSPAELAERISWLTQV
jgi:predicted acylesterase/phospholipase RssA